MAINSLPILENIGSMQKTAITLSPAPNLADNNWNFAEVWIDPLLSPPYILLLLAESSGNYRVYDPSEGYQVVFTGASYEEAENWLLEDEFEPVEGRLSPVEI
ncbi:MAG: hypothetical protein EWV75_19420 [Microcystis wesenbergii Mw_QC_S_20081001_S30D]|jgi:hypothetical protein|uniref:Uncharacterized protein n=1 Tax=Microcystis wesenbergii Mw_QC_S_20081001_S30D TaxID=2486245 RepID=A0A552JAY4_9CHRO|nr:hypothetical protein [Microcystis aeruginosa W11-03]NCR95783.1 hypothetical protein [Microcystis aeruginosa W11-06]TRU92925.1 MAG: hypothetical protein EWV75_19420 [Microcystis wesenbergii Mw_QC_S_20081001_S30D]TRU94880.1 MAG: hypothetical protein EWV73_21560 [Microcystis wesenbergii Mw_QC_B_20070930_S4D]TRU95157.1 MAG: hypothetical protein EWV74_20625 [Microcystis wesenbergii Mw_QC_S_20081001_S30]TRV17439.1 MAG: hypothetical protein EWV89_02730 [Microcystis wesenbergii Mw_QC_B_20070930_S4]